MYQSVEISRFKEPLKQKSRAVALALGVFVAANGVEYAPQDNTPRAPLEATAGMYGGNVAGYDWGGTMDAARVIEDLQRIGARYNVFNPALFMENGVILENHQQTPHLDDVAELTRRSRDANLPVVIKPIVEVDKASGYTWRGEIIPEDADAWFGSYGYVVEQQYAAAYSEGARTLIIGTELSNLEGEEYSQYWEDLIDYMKEQYPGTVIAYDQNWDKMGEDPAFAHKLDAISYSMYGPMDEDEPLLDQWRAWAARIEALEQETGIPREAGEFGFPLTGTPEAPNQENKFPPYTIEPNPELVAEYIGAACQAFDEVDIPHALWGTYTHSVEVNGKKLDVLRGFYVSAPENAALGKKILEACSQ